MEWYWILLIMVASVLLIFVLSIFFYKPFFKRIYDFALSLLAIIVLSPLFIFLTIIGAIAMGGNPFFVQERPGKNEKIFKMIKFRSMNYKKDKSGKLLDDKHRMNKYGSFIRNTSLDELPELFNILVGNMSIVGPRPLLKEYLSRYNDEQKQRHAIKPGLTGYAQINGRNALTWEEKFSYDVYYVKNYSLFFDIKIILGTVLVVLKRKNVDSSESNTMEEFKGDSN